MQKLVIDTNIFISYLISKNGFAYKIINQLVLPKKILHYISSETLEEYSEVSGRVRFTKKYPDFLISAHALLNDLIKISVYLTPSSLFNIIKDSSDNKFLELAYEANADCLITGNKLHFTFSSFYNTQIVSPREYRENYKP